jgi:hypothetical protein
LFALVVFGALLWFGKHNGDNATFVNGRFRIWAAVATASLMVWVMLFQRGRAEVRALPEPWHRPRSWWTWNVAAYAALGVLTAVMIGMVTSGNRAAVPIDHFPALINTLTFLGWVSAAPWVLMVWITHERVRDLATATAQIAPPQSTDEYDPTLIDSAVTSIAQGTIEVRELIERSALALALLVSTTVLNTGALRFALVNSKAVNAGDFPSWWVLGYGALFSVVVAVVITPLLLAWRTQALELADRALGMPPSGIPSETLVAARQRFESRLGITARLLRRPITVLSILAPLATSILIAFLSP